METILDTQAAMAEMRRNGATYKQIAAEFHYTPNGVLYILRKTPNTYKIQQIAEMVKMYQNGFSAAKIAEKYGMSTNGVLYRLHNAGCDINPRGNRSKACNKDIVKLHCEGVNPKKVAERVGCSLSHVYAILKSRRISSRRTDSQLPINAKIKEMYENGVSVSEIGRKLDMNRSTVNYRLCKMGCKNTTGGK